MACVQPIVASYADVVKKSIDCLPGVPSINIPVQTCRSQSRTPSPVKDLQRSFFAPIKRSCSNTTAEDNSQEFDRSVNGGGISQDKDLTQVWQLEDFFKQVDQLVEDSVHRCRRCNADSGNGSNEYCLECRLERERSSKKSTVSSFHAPDYTKCGSERTKRRIPDYQEASDEEEHEEKEDIVPDAPVRSILYKPVEQHGYISSTCDEEESDGNVSEGERAEQQSDASSVASDNYHSANDKMEVGSTDEAEEAIQTDEGGTSSEETTDHEECHEDGPTRPPRLSRQNGVCTYPSREFFNRSSYFSSNGACGGQSESEHADTVYPDISYYYSNENANDMDSLDTFKETDCLISAGRPSSMSSTYSFPRRAAKDIEDVVNFWETDFQVDDAMVPSMGSWEKREIIPDENLENLDYKKYLAYKKLYEKWVQCGKSLERWYEKYWGYSLLGILRTKKYNSKTRMCNCCNCII